MPCVTSLRASIISVMRKKFKTKKENTKIMSSSSEERNSSDTVSSSDGSEEFISLEVENFGTEGYQFQPTREISSSEGDSSSDSYSSSTPERLNNLDWCKCGHCQIMDRELECICCHEIQEIVEKNREVFEKENLESDITCITDNPGFKAVCLNQWVLEAAWLQYRQQYGNQCHEGPEHKKNRHTAYRQLVRWCWGVLGKEIRVVLSSCAVMCIRAHFPPPGLEEDFEFVGFRYSDE